LPQHLDTVEVTFLTPAAIRKVHAEFMRDPTPTDVITFEHGEILVCPAVAEKQRKATGLTLHHEVLTYILHGLLHLCGLDDHSEKDFARMGREQGKLLQKLRPVR
jgi:probable rRNA maturation factor